MKIRHPWLIRAFTWIALRVLRLLFATCRQVVFVEEPGSNPHEDTGDERFFYSIWHDQLLMTIYTGKAKTIAALVGPHRDGGYVADILNDRKVPVIRGSSNRGGTQAVKEMMETAKDLHIAITPDGPRGPRHEAKAGMIFLSSQTGRPIVPVAYTCNRLWKIRGSWTDMMLPKPFTTIYLAIGTPLRIPSGLKKSERQARVRQLNEEMVRVERLAERMQAGETLEPSAETPTEESLANAA